MKFRLYIYILLFFSTIMSISAQQLSVDWATKFGGRGWDFSTSMVKLGTGNFVIGGSLKGTLPNDSTHDVLLYSNNAYIASCDSMGETLWQKTFGGGLFDNITSMSKTASGVMISGTFQDSLFFETLKIFTPAFSGGYNALVDNEGNPLWLRQIGGSATISNILNCTSPGGKTFLAGSFIDSLNLNGVVFSEPSEKGVFLTRINEDGMEINSHVVKSTGMCTIGGLSCNDTLVCIAGSFSDSLKIADTILVSMGEEDIFVLLFDQNCNLIKAKTAGGSENEQVRSLMITDLGQIVLTGFFENAFLIDSLIISSNGGRDIFITMIDTAFNAEWIKNIGGQGNDYSFSLSSNDKNEFFVSGNFVHYMQLPDESGNMIEIDASSAFGNAFIAKFSSSGHLLASFNLPASSEDFCTSLVLGDNGKITAVGNFYKQMNFQGYGGSIADSLVSDGERDIFLLQFIDLCHNVTFSAGPDTAICNGQTFSLSAPGSYQYFRWLPDGLPNQEYEVQNPGTYKLIMTDLNGCILSDSIVINEKDLAVALAGNDTTLNAGDILFLESAVTLNCDQFEWSSNGTGYFNNTSLINASYSPSNDDISTGTILITLSASNQCGTSSDSRLVTIDQEDDGITVFPNPTSGIVTLVCTEGLIIQTATIVTQSGNVIQTEIPINSTFMQFDLAPYPPGTFLFHLTTPANTITKIINKL